MTKEIKFVVAGTEDPVVRIELYLRDDDDGDPELVAEHPDGQELVLGYFAWGIFNRFSIDDDDAEKFGLTTDTTDSGDSFNHKLKVL